MKELSRPGSDLLANRMTNASEAPDFSLYVNGGNTRSQMNPYFSTEDVLANGKTDMGVVPAKKFACPASSDGKVALPTQLPFGLTNLEDCTRYNKNEKVVSDYQSVQHSVVKISGERTYTLTDGTIKSYSPYASGFFVTGDGMIATGLHPLRGLKNITVQTGDGRKFGASIAAVDRRHDIAILQLENASNQGFKPLVMGSSQSLASGDSINGWGYPLDSDRLFVSPSSVPGSGFRSRTTLQNVLENGVGRPLMKTELNNLLLSGENAQREVLQADILVNRGNSGGPITDSTNQVVGIIGLSDTRNQTFATPIEPVVKLLNYALNRTSNIYFDEVDPAGQETAARREERLKLRAERLELEINRSSVQTQMMPTAPNLYRPNQLNGIFKY